MVDVQGVLTLFCSGAAQVVCHEHRVEELTEQLEVEEEDGDRHARWLCGCSGSFLEPKE